MDRSNETAEGQQPTQKVGYFFGRLLRVEAIAPHPLGQAESMDNYPIDWLNPSTSDRAILQAAGIQTVAQLLSVDWRSLEAMGLSHELVQLVREEQSGRRVFGD